MRIVYVRCVDDIAPNFGNQRGKSESKAGQGEKHQHLPVFSFLQQFSFFYLLYLKAFITRRPARSISRPLQGTSNQIYLR